MQLLSLCVIPGSPTDGWEPVLHRELHSGCSSTYPEQLSVLLFPFLLPPPLPSVLSSLHPLLPGSQTQQGLSCVLNFLF